jgi:8-amino-7-oxononanoate synthase
MPTAIDLFEKARRHERLEQLRAAREHDLMPYFRVLEGPAGGKFTQGVGGERVAPIGVGVTVTS